MSLIKSQINNFKYLMLKWLLLKQLHRNSFLEMAGTVQAPPLLIFKMDTGAINYIHSFPFA